METLKNMKGKIDEDKLFDIIEDLKITKKEYSLEIQRENWAHKKSQILESLYLG